MKFLHKLLKGSVGQNLTEITTYKYPSGLFAVIVASPNTVSKLFPNSRIRNGLNTAITLNENEAELGLVKLINELNTGDYDNSVVNIILRTMYLNQCGDRFNELKQIIHDRKINLYLYIDIASLFHNIELTILPYTDIAFELLDTQYKVTNKRKISLM